MESNCPPQWSYCTLFSKGYFKEREEEGRGRGGKEGHRERDGERERPRDQAQSEHNAEGWCEGIGREDVSRHLKTCHHFSASSTDSGGVMRSSASCRARGKQNNHLCFWIPPTNLTPLGVFLSLVFRESAPWWTPSSTSRKLPWAFWVVSPAGRRGSLQGVSEAGSCGSFVLSSEPFLWDPPIPTLWGKDGAGRRWAVASPAKAGQVRSAYLQENFWGDGMDAWSQRWSLPLWDYELLEHSCLKR